MARAEKKAEDQRRRVAATAKALQERKAANLEAERREVAAARRRAWAASVHTPDYRARQEAEHAAEIESAKERRRVQQQRENEENGVGRRKYVFQRIVSGGLPGSARRR